MALLPRSLDEAHWSNSFVDKLPGDNTGSSRPRQTLGVCYARVAPTPVRDPHLLAWSHELAAYLGVTQPSGTHGPVVEILGGNRVTPDMKPFAARYGGHQFGNWAGQLGDGRAISLGEIEATDGSVQEIQLKGSGLTPYSRRGDGRAVLRSSLREFLCSEAMHHLGIPTTRALSLVGTGESVVRDMFYDGNPQAEPGAIVARVAPTFVRFGNFQILTACGETDNLQALADYVLQHHYKDLGTPSATVYVHWFEEVCRRTAVLIAHWMSVGFVHGVMNTDNLSILGLTIDYGPYGWLEPYEPNWTPNTTDFGQRRYAFGQQPQIGLWNLAMLAQALTPLVPDGEAFVSGLELYRTTFADTYAARMRAKLGVTALASHPDTASLLQDLETHLVRSEVDMTLFFRHLCHVVPALLSGSSPEPLFRELLEACSYLAPGNPRHENLLGWLHRYAQVLRREPVEAKAVQAEMLRANPKYVLRNYLAQNAIDQAEQGDLTYLNRLLRVLQAPFDEQPEQGDLAAKRPDWARAKPGCATLSCSS